MSHIASLKLHQFRSYAQARLETLAPGFVVLCGPNGAGKTNILEAVSLLAPGRGLRGAKMLEIQAQGAAAPWAVSAEIETAYGRVQIGTGLDPKTERRLVRLNGEAQRGQARLADYFACVWLTPQMDRLLMDSASQRRKFLDRLVFAADPSHAGRVSRYENAMAQRARLLREGRSEPVWLTGLEAQMAEAGVAIAAARREVVSRLQSALMAAPEDDFPRALIAAAGTIETLLQQAPALEVEELFAYQLKESRPRDALTGGAATGVHKSDFAVRYAAKNMPADQCSTGEQKALLISIVLAHARLIAAERGRAPVLLLDEIAAHLEEGRRAALYAHLESIGGQVWLTGTEEALFAPLAHDAQMFEVSGGVVAGLRQAA
jgi:DNA replication and repair protein RecF